MPDRAHVDPANPEQLQEAPHAEHESVRERLVGCERLVLKP